VCDQKKSVAIRLFCFFFKLTDCSSSAAVATATAGNTCGAADGRRPPSPPRPISPPKNKIKKDRKKVTNAMQCNAGDDEHSQSETTTTTKILEEKTRKKSIKNRTRVDTFLRSDRYEGNDSGKEAG
jgi:hypothetical protein